MTQDAPAPPAGGRGVRDAILYVATNFVARGLAFLLVPLFAHLLPAPEYGAWGVALSVGNFASLVLLFGLYVPVSRIFFEARDEATRAGAFRAVLGFQLIGGAAAAAALDLTLRLLPLEAPALAASRLAVWSAWLTNLSLVPLTLLRVRERVTAFAVVSSGAALVSLVAPLAALWWGPPTAAQALRGSLYGGAVMALVYVTLARRDVGAPLRWATLGALLAQGAQFLPQSLSSWILNLSDRLVLERLLDLGQVGVYTAGYSIGMAVMLVCEGVGNAWFTFYLRHQQDPAQAPAIARASTSFVAAGAAAGTMGALFGPLVVGWVLPDRYAPAAPVVAWVSLAYAMWAPYLVFVYTVMSLGRWTVLPVLNYVPAALNVGLNLLWVPRWGLEGAALATLVSVAALAALDGVLAARVRPLPHELGRWAAVLAATAAAGVVGRLAGTAGAAAVGLRLAAALAWVAFVAAVPLRDEAARVRRRLASLLGYHAACL